MRSLLILSLLLWHGTVYALPGRHYHTALSVDAVASQRELDRDSWIGVNDLDMAVTNHGSFGYDIPHGVGGLHFPASSDNTAMFAAGLWVAGHVQGQVRATVAEYSWEFIPGVIFPDGTWPDMKDSRYRVYEITADSGPGDPDYDEWPVHEGAPINANGDPLLAGAKTMYSTYHDADVSQHSNDAGSTQPLGLEVHHLTYAFDLPTAPLSRAVIHDFVIENKGEAAISDAIFTIWSDVDLGGAADDLCGSIPSLQAVYTYNATNRDNVYGSNPPATAFALLGGARLGDRLGSSIAFTNGGDPSSATETYNCMLGLKRDGSPMIDPTTGLPSRFWFDGYPGDPEGWRDENPADRRMMLSTPPRHFAQGERVHLRCAAVVAQGADRIASARLLYPQIEALHRLEAKGAFPIPARWAVAGAFQDTSTALASACVLAPENGMARVRVLDASGHLVKEIVPLQPFEPGITAVQWDGLDAQDNPVSAGEYIFELRVNESTGPDFGAITDRERFDYLPVGQRPSNGGNDGLTSPALVARNHGNEQGTQAQSLELRTRMVSGGAHIQLVGSSLPTVPGEVRIIAPTGRVVRTLFGSAEFEWDGKDANGRTAPSSLYLVRYQSEKGVAAGRLVWLRD